MNKTYAVADLHGQYQLWLQIKDYLQPEDKLYILGDCGDRGPDGWKIIKEALIDSRVVYLRGNHEQMLLDAWRYEWHGDDFYLWMQNGGWETYDAMLFDRDYEIILQQLARTKLYEQYVNIKGDIIHLSHAGFTLMQDNVIPDNEDLLWGRDHIFDKCVWWAEENPNDFVIHGHTPIQSDRFNQISRLYPTEISVNDSKTVAKYCGGHKVCIDGGCFLTNKCAILDLDTFEEIVFD